MALRGTLPGEHIVVSNVAAGVGVSRYRSSLKVMACGIAVDAAGGIYYTVDGTNPSSTNYQGQVAAGGYFELTTQDEVALFKSIRQTVDTKIHTTPALHYVP